MIVTIKGQPRLDDAIALLQLIADAYPAATMRTTSDGHEITIPDGAQPEDT